MAPACGGGEGVFGPGVNRTPDLLITNELLYRLSYTGLASNYSAEW